MSKKKLLLVGLPVFLVLLCILTSIGGFVGYTYVYTPIQVKDYLDKSASNDYKAISTSLDALESDLAKNYNEEDSSVFGENDETAEVIADIEKAEQVGKALADASDKALKSHPDSSLSATEDLDKLYKDYYSNNKKIGQNYAAMSGDMKFMMQELDRLMKEFEKLNTASAKIETVNDIDKISSSFKTVSSEIKKTNATLKAREISDPETAGMRDLIIEYFSTLDSLVTTYSTAFTKMSTAANTSNLALLEQASKEVEAAGKKFDADTKSFDKKADDLDKKIKTKFETYTDEVEQNRSKIDAERKRLQDKYNL